MRNNQGMTPQDIKRRLNHAYLDTIRLGCAEVDGYVVAGWARMRPAYIKRVQAQMKRDWGWELDDGDT